MSDNSKNVKQIILKKDLKEERIKIKPKYYEETIENESVNLKSEIRVKRERKPNKLYSDYLFM